MKTSPTPVSTILKYVLLSTYLLLLTTGSNAQSFSATPLNWPTPIGGALTSSGTALGFNLVGSTGCNFANCESWSLIDMNGDSRSDLVVTGSRIGAFYQQFGIGSSPYWKVYLNNGSGFDANPVNWTTPTGGDITSGTQLGFIFTSGNGSNQTNSENWSTFDINNDDLPDLVVTSRYTAFAFDQFGAGTSPYWKVFINNGSGFSTTPINWPTPVGGNYDGNGNSQGFIYLFSNTCNNQLCQRWGTTDINGDDLPDLIIAAERSGAFHTQFNVGSAPYWKIYTNTGTGFSSTPINWPTPVGGAFSGSTAMGFNDVFSSGCNFTNCNSWSTEDINGDGLKDLVVTALYTLYLGQPMNGSNPYWNVYLNYGSGFNSSPTTWGTPSGGNFTSFGVQLGYNTTNGTSNNNTDCENWSTVDFNNDSKPELVVTSKYSVANSQFGIGTSPYWKVYPNTGTGFQSLPTNWSTPVGGTYSSTANPRGYITLSGTGSNILQSQNWTTTDLNGDHIPDLIITAEHSNGFKTQFGAGTSPYWNVYTGTGFSSMETTESHNQITPYPNPANDYFNIENPTQESGIYQIKDLSGKVIKSGLLTPGINTIQADITNGLYIIHIENNSLNLSRKICILN